MMNKSTHIFLLILLLSSCQEPGKNISEENKVIQTEQKINVEDSIPEKVKGIDLFIEYMKEENFVMDTIRLSKIWAWKEAAKCDKEIFNGAIQIKFPFPVEDYRKYLSDPITYFWVKKNPQDSTNNDGLEFLLLTYNIDSTGMNMEREIYKSLSSYYMNFPTYCIRNENRIYILTNRMSVQEEVTEKFAKKLRDFIEPKSVIFGHYGMDTIR